MLRFERFDRRPAVGAIDVDGDQPDRAAHDESDVREREVLPPHADRLLIGRGQLAPVDEPGMLAGRPAAVRPR